MTDEIWLEKYRPITLDEVQGNIEAVNHIKEFANKGNIPNVILAVSHLLFNERGPLVLEKPPPFSVLPDIY